MARVNVSPDYSHVRTHEGAQAWPHMTPAQALRRSVCSCLLWENEFYEDGESIASRIEAHARAVAPEVLAELAIEARTDFNLRHAPLLLLSVLGETGRGRKDGLVANTVATVIQRPDELGELLAIHAKRHGRGPGDLRGIIPSAFKRGLAEAFTKFDEYQFAKYDRDTAIKLRDVMRLVHPQPSDSEENALWGRVINRTLKTPDTWEVALSGGADKAETFTRLLSEGRLGYLALLRNLRNMVDAGVDMGLVKEAILARKGAARVLPFRYIAAARAAPSLAKEVNEALCARVQEMPSLLGKTLVLVDVSGSMSGALSSRSDLTRMDAAAGLASVLSGEVRVFSFSSGGARYYRDITSDLRVLVEVPPYAGLPGIEAIVTSQEHGGTLLGKAVTEANELPHDRLIVITDEQSHDRIPDPIAPLAYMINIASCGNGVGYGKWVHIDGFSERVIQFIHEHEGQFHG